MGAIVVVRHGETQWSRAGRHTGVSEVMLTSTGTNQALALGRALSAWRFLSVFTGPPARVRDTASLAGWHERCVDPDLAEWDFGGYEGLTLAETRERAGHPDWLLWDNGVVPGRTPGESLAQVSARADRVLARARRFLEHGHVAMVADGHILRILSARWLGMPPQSGRLLPLSVGSFGVLTREHGRPVITQWNTPAAR
ncbi:histidine phosphatase family protein [Actinacidiphila alni]|uniref:histidine phosphatase family protein n=1 Tax=Actinacidiphila alni TaxID=380248 RepID=UPI003453F237